MGIGEKVETDRKCKIMYVSALNKSLRNSPLEDYSPNTNT